MGKTTEIAVVLRLRDQMGGQAAKSLDTLTRAARGVGRVFGGAAEGVRSMRIEAARTDKVMGGLGQTASRAARGVEDVGRAANTVRGNGIGQAAREADKLGKEMDQAARSGNRLRDALRSVATTGRTALSAVKGIGRGIGQAGAGMAAGAGVAAAALRQPIAFEKRMTLMANTAFSDEKDVSKRLEGRKRLVDAVDASVRVGGGKRDDAADALEGMLASGKIASDAAERILPDIMKTASASGASAKDLSDMVVQGVSNKLFSVDQAKEALEKGLVSGQVGGFELKDSSKWIGKFAAYAAGMRGMKGYEEILAFSQAAVSTAGSKDEAGNNLVNLLQKINSQDTQKDFAKLGIDLTGTLVKAREDGMFPLEAFAKLVENNVIGKDKRYVTLKKKLEKTNDGGERQKILEDMSELTAQAAMGTVAQDRQMALALISAINQKDYIKQVKERLANSSGEVDRSFDTYKASTAYSVEHMANEAEIARGRMLGDVSGPLKAAADTAADLAQRFPTLATAATEAATSIGVMSAAAAAFGAMRLFTGGAAGGAAAAAGRGGLVGMLGGKGGALLTAGLAAWDIYATESNDALTRAQKNVSHAENAGGLAAAIAGMKVGAMGGAAVGSMVPGIGTAVGGVLGGLAGGAMGWWGGSHAGRWAGEQVWGPSGEAKADAQKIVVEDKGTLHVESVLHVDGHEMARVVNSYNTADAKRE